MGKGKSRIEKPKKKECAHQVIQFPHSIDKFIPLWIWFSVQVRVKNEKLVAALNDQVDEIFRLPPKLSSVSSSDLDRKVCQFLWDVIFMSVAIIFTMSEQWPDFFIFFRRGRKSLSKKQYSSSKRLMTHWIYLARSSIGDGLFERMTVVFVSVFIFIGLVVKNKLKLVTIVTLRYQINQSKSQ